LKIIINCCSPLIGYIYRCVAIHYNSVTAKHYCYIFFNYCVLNQYSFPKNVFAEHVSDQTHVDIGYRSLTVLFWPSKTVNEWELNETGSQFWQNTKVGKLTYRHSSIILWVTHRSHAAYSTLGWLALNIKVIHILT